MGTQSMGEQTKSFHDRLQELCDDEGFAAEKSTSKFLRFNEIELEGEVLDFVSSYVRSRGVDDVLSCGLANAVARVIISDDEKLALSLVEQEDKKRLFDGSKVFNCAMDVLKETVRKWTTNMPEFGVSQLDLFVSVDSIKNKRRKMEDRHVHLPHLNALLGLPKETPQHSLFAVYDGHGGVDAANYAANQLHINLRRSDNFKTDLHEALIDAFRSTDEAFVAKAKDEGLRSGSTAVLVLISSGKMYVAWLGDSQVVLSKGGKCVQLMNGHKPDREDERKRIAALGGCVVWFGGWRVNGCLSVSRAIGDYEQKPFISSAPDLTVVDLEGDEDFLVLACDGLWDVVNEEECVVMVQGYLSQGMDQSVMARRLVDEAKSRGSMDNITVLVVLFNDLSQQKSEKKEISVDTSLHQNNSIDNKHFEKVLSIDNGLSSTEDGNVAIIGDDDS